MVNLLPLPPRPGGEGARFEVGESRRIAARLAPLVELIDGGRLSALDHALESLAPELEELASAPHRIAALALLEAVAALRVEAARRRPDGDRGTGGRVRSSDDGGGAFVCHRPGRSLATGEAEIASRGFFDVEDRPPLACWLGLLSLPEPVVEGEADFVIVTWVDGADIERARAGCRACGSGALAWLDDFAPTAAAQLRQGLASSGGD